MAPPVPVSPNQGDAQRPREPSTIYKLIMTPLIFTSFLLSLALVDLRNSALRAHYHADAAQPRRLPAWLHRVVYRYRPYRYGAVDQQGRPLSEVQGQSPVASPGSVYSPVGSPATSPGTGKEAGDYYHSKQKKLMKMEAAEAFEIRGAVVVVLGLVSLGVFWAVWRVLCWGLGAVGVW